MQYIVIISLIIVLCVSIYLSSFKQIESFETEDEQIENYLGQYKRKLDTLKELLTEYAKQAENNLLSAKATKNKTTIRSLATKNTNLLEAVKVINQLPLIILLNSKMNEPGFTVEDFENDLDEIRLIDTIKKKIRELESSKEEEEEEQEEEEEEQEKEEKDDDTNYEKVAALEKASEEARLAEEEAKRIRIEEEVRLAEEAKKQTILTAKNELKSKMNELNRGIYEGLALDSIIDVNKILALLCKISNMIKTPSVYFPRVDTGLIDYNERNKTNMYGFSANDVNIEVNSSLKNWSLKFYSASSATNVILEGKYFVDPVQNPLDKVFPPLLTESSVNFTAKVATPPSPVFEQYKGTYVPNRAVDNAMYRLLLIYKELQTALLIIDGMKNIKSSYDYKKLVSDIENVPDDLDKIKQLYSTIENKLLDTAKLFDNYINPLIDTSNTSRLYRYAWYIMDPFNWADYYTNNRTISEGQRNNLFCCNVNAKCITDYIKTFQPAPWTFYLRKV